MSPIKTLDPLTYPPNETPAQVARRVAHDQVKFGVATGEQDLRYLLEDQSRMTTPAPPPTLVTMRLADMKRVHPAQITRNCCECAQPVGVYPSGQAAIAKRPDMLLICHRCFRREPGHIILDAPGAGPKEASESVPR